jgi:hypothetical protein
MTGNPEFVGVELKKLHGSKPPLSFDIAYARTHSMACRDSLKSSNLVVGSSQILARGDWLTASRALSALGFASNTRGARRPVIERQE